MKSKEAQRRKQVKAQKRKRQLAEKQKTKKLARKTSGPFRALVDRWMKLDPSALPVEAPCPACSGQLGAHDQGHELELLHSDPHCAVYVAFTRANDAANAEEDARTGGGGISMDEVLSRMVPEWTRGPCTEITEDEGDALLDSKEVLDFSQMMSGGHGPSYAYARTEKGLFRWVVENDGFGEEDVDFDDLEEDEEVSEVTQRASVDEPDVSPPSVSADWQLIEEIGQGGYATVWRAERPGSQPTAIKKLLPEQQGKVSLIAEWEALERARHPGVVRALEADAHSLVLDYIEGPTIGDELRDEKVWTLSDTLPILENLCDALGAVHRGGFVHHDVNPNNIILAGPEYPILIDFGCVIRIGQRQTNPDRHPQWLSPEAVREQEASVTDDLWPIPLLALAMLTGLSPVAGPPGMVREHLSSYDGFGTPEDPNLPPGFDRWWHKATHPDPAKRYRSAAEMKQSLGALAS